MKKTIACFIFVLLCTMCVFAVTPAKNMLTGTKDALNFEDVSGADYFTYGNQEYIKYMTYNVVNDTTGSGRGKMFEAKADLSAIGTDLGNDTYIYYQLKKALAEKLDRPAHLIYETNGSGQIGFWLNAVDNKHTGTLTGSWKMISVNDSGNILNSPAELKIQYATRKNGCTVAQYLDNIALYPYYKIVYVPAYPDGTEGVATTKYYFDAANLKVAKNGTVSGLPTSYTIESVSASFPGYNFLGWTTVKNGKTAMTFVNLSNEDITLYPVWEKKTVVMPVNVTVYLDEAKKNKITDVCDAGFVFKLPTYTELAQYTKSGKMPIGFRMNGVLYAPGKSVMLPEEDKVVFTAEYADTLHAEYGELVVFENFESLENGKYICDGTQSTPINISYINPSWSTNKEHFQLRYGDSMNKLQVAQNGESNMLKVTKIKASSMWPQMYLFNNGGTPDGLYTVVADFVIPASEISHLTNVNVRVYYSGKTASNVQTTVTSLSNGEKGVSVACTIAVSQGSDITAIPKIQIFATADATDYNTSFYVDNISVYHKKAYASVKLSDTKTKKIFFTPGEEITLPYSYEILDSIPEGCVLSGFKHDGKNYSEGAKYITKATDSTLDFEAVYEKRVYALKFETGKANGTVGEIKILDGEKITLPDSGLYHTTLTLVGWKLKGSNTEFAKGEEFTFKASSYDKYFDGTYRLVFEPVFSGADFTVYGFKNDIVVPEGTPTFKTLLSVADGLYYGVRKSTSPNKTDAERLTDMVSKGISRDYSNLTKKATFNDAAEILANTLPENYYNELCFDVEINGGDEALKLVRAGIFDESTDFAAEISYTELCNAVEKLTDSTKRSVQNKRTFFVLGDSLTEAYGPSNPTKGWPEFIDNYFTGNITTANYGIAGINTGTYFNPSHARATEYYNKMITSVRSGDYVIIALGTNDSTLWGRGSMTKQQSLDNYNRLISEIRAQGGIPVLVGPVGRNETDENGNYKESDPEIIPTMQSVNEVYGVNVPIINFKDISFDRLSVMTAAERGEFYIDSVHYRAKGADMVAGWFEELVLLSCDIQLEAFKYHFQDYCMEDPVEYITIDIGGKANQNNVRIAQINGARVFVEQNMDELSVPVYAKNFIVEIIEKEKAEDIFTVTTNYYYVDSASKTYTKLSAEDFYGTKEDVSIRTKSPVGVRFKAEILNKVKTQTQQAVVEEYGFIVSRNDLLETAGAELTFDFPNHVSGVAYNRQDGTDIVFDSSDDEITVFAGVLYNIPEQHYKAELVCKTYTKVSVGKEAFVLYGEAVRKSVYEIAKENLENTLPEEQRNLLQSIVDSVEKTDIDIDVDGLYK